MRSEDFNTLVQVWVMENGEWQRLKDAYGSPDAVLSVVLPASGEYRIRAGSQQRGETGAYTLTLESRFF